MPKIRLPEVDCNLRLMMVLAYKAHLEHDKKYPQWALDEEKELYGVTVIDRVCAGLVYASYNWCLEEGLTEEQAVEAVRNRILFNKFMD